jgi:hypothetical protein
MANRFLSNIRINDAYTFPASDGTNNQVIKTDGSGNLSFGQLAADSASVMYKDTFTGDGSTTGFSLANALNDEVQSNIYIDGVYQSKSTYSVSGTTLTFSTAPASGHEIEVISTTGINSGPTAIYTDTFTANGSATAFTLGQTVHDENQTIVFLNGVYQFKGTYTLSGTTLTLDTAPANGVAIEVMSIGSAYSGGDILYDHDFTSAGLMTTNGSGVYSITTNNSANWNTAYGWGDHSTQSYATQSYVGTQISNLVDSSPATLNTLNELAAALGDDPNFATTTATSIGLKAPLASPSFTGNATFGGNVTVGNSGNINIPTASSGNANLYFDGTDFKITSNSSSANLKLETNSTTRLTINNAGNVTLNSATDLDFQVADFAQIKFRESGAIMIDSDNNQSSRNFSIKDGDGTNLLLITDTGNATFAGDVHAGGRLRSDVGSDSGTQLNLWADSNGHTFLAGFDFAIYTGGNNARTQSFIIDSSKNATFNGNVGIGATSSSSRLKVAGPNTSSNPLVDLVASGTGSFQRGVRLLNGGMNAGDEIMYAVGRSDNSRNMGQVYFYYAGDGSTSNRISMGLHSVDDVFNIAGTGNVGIGTPDPDHKLEVVGGLALRNSNSRLYFGTNNGPDRRALEGNVNGTLLQIGEGYSKTMLYGNVGIGDTTPSFPLVISKSSSSTSNGADLSMRLALSNPDQTNNNYALIAFGDGTSEPGSGFMGMQFTDHTNNYGELVFGTRGGGGYGERMRITSDGSLARNSKKVWNFTAVKSFTEGGSSDNFFRLNFTGNNAVLVNITLMSNNSATGSRTMQSVQAMLSTSYQGYVPTMTEISKTQVSNNGSSYISAVQGANGSLTFLCDTTNNTTGTSNTTFVSVELICNGAIDATITVL